MVLKFKHREKQYVDFPNELTSDAITTSTWQTEQRDKLINN